MQSGSDLRLTLAGKKWVLEGDPYSLMRAAKALPLTKRLKNGSVSLPATPETASELMWFRSRFPFHTSAEHRLRSDSAKDKLRRIRLAMIGRSPPSNRTQWIRAGEKLRDYQVHAADVFWAGGSLLLADDVGLGKTVSAIASISEPKRLPAIVVCPANLTLQWQEKLTQFTNLRTHILKQTSPYDLRIAVACGGCGETPKLTGAVKDRCSFCGESRFVPLYPEVLITSYHKLDGWSDQLPGWAKTVVFDEVQELRIRQSKKYVAAEKIAVASEYRLGLSATPIHNYGGEMFNVLEVLFPGALGSRADFRSTWCGGAGADGGIRDPRITEPEAFGRYLSNEKMILRRTREQVGRELPPQQQIIVPMQVSLDATTHRKAKELAKILLAPASSDNRHSQFEARAGLDAMVRKATGIAKAKEVAAFTEMLLDSGEPVMLFGWHKSVYEIWAKELSRFSPAFYTGDQGVSQKAQAKADFAAGRTDLIIVSLRSGAGLDGLQHRCRIGVFGELDWAPAVHVQCVGRYHRDGQSQGSLTYLMLNSEGSDPYVAEVLGVKTSQLTGVILDGRASSVLRQEEANSAIRRMAEAYLDS